MVFETRATYERRPQRVTASYALDKMPDDPKHDDPKHIGEELFQEKYILECKVATYFWSNTAQLDRKRQDAEKMTKAYLFKDMLPIVSEILLEAESEEVFALAGRLKDMMRGE